MRLRGSEAHTKARKVEEVKEKKAKRKQRVEFWGLWLWF
jgi:hypothetical protein